MIRPWARAILAGAVVGSGIVMLVACGAQPGEATSETGEALSCPPGSVSSCSYDAETRKTTCWCAARSVEQDVCQADTRNAGNTWLARAGCTSPYGTRVSMQGTTGASVTVWTCTNSSAVPPDAGRKLFGDSATQTEVVDILIRGNTGHPACGSSMAGTHNLTCDFTSLNSSCYADPVSGQFVVYEYYVDATSDGGINNLCGGTNCGCNAMCGGWK